MFMSSQNSYVDILMLNVMVLEGIAFQRIPGHENGISFVISDKAPHRYPLPFFMLDILRSMIYQRMLSPDYAATLTSNFQSPEL